MEQVNDYLKRLQLSGSVGSQALEFYRLCEVKCPRTFSPSCLAVICIELSCGKLRVPFDKKEAVKLSGEKPKAYNRAFQTVEKLLNVSSTIGLQEMAVRFDCLRAVGVAKELLERYKKSLSEKFSKAQQEGLDLGKPLYPAAALYCSCKLLKIRCDQTKFVAISRAKKSSFQMVLDEMNKCAPDNVEEFKESTRKRKRLESTVDQMEDDNVGVSGEELPVDKPLTELRLNSRLQSDPTSVEYLKWKEDTIKRAKAELSAR